MRRFADQKDKTMFLMFSAQVGRISMSAGRMGPLFHKGQMINAIENYGELFLQSPHIRPCAAGKVMAKGADVVLGDRVEGVDTTLKMCRLRSGRDSLSLPDRR